MRRITAFFAILFTVNAFGGIFGVNFGAYQEIKCFQMKDCLYSESGLSCSTCEKLEEPKKLHL
jgi:hypothetical protein